MSNGLREPPELDYGTAKKIKDEFNKTKLKDIAKGQTEWVQRQQTRIQKLYAKHGTSANEKISKIM